jgi:hypothetical protein
MKKLTALLLATIIITSALSVFSVSAVDETTEESVKITSIELDKKYYGTSHKEEFTIIATLFSGDEEIEINKDVIQWTTSDKTVAYPTSNDFNSSGVNVVGSGTCYITATYEGLSAKCKVIVNKKKNEFKYTVLKDKTIRIDDYNWFDTSVSIPKTYKGKKVTQVNLYNSSTLFVSPGFSYVKKVKIPSTVTKIKNANNTLSSLKELNVSKNNKVYSSINGVLFNKAKTKLIAYPSNIQSKSYTVPKSVKTIGKSAFVGNWSYLEKVTLQKGITTIEDNAFNDTRLKSINIPSTVKTIGNYAFANTLFNKIKIPKSVTKIGEGAFGYSDYDPYYGYINGFVIKGYKGTEAEKYAKKHKELVFKAL